MFIVASMATGLIEFMCFVVTYTFDFFFSVFANYANMLRNSLPYM